MPGHARQIHPAKILIRAVTSIRNKMTVKTWIGHPSWLATQSSILDTISWILAPESGAYGPRILWVLVRPYWRVHIQIQNPGLSQLYGRKQYQTVLWKEICGRMQDHHPTPVSTPAPTNLLSTFSWAYRYMYIHNVCMYIYIYMFICKCWADVQVKDRIGKHKTAHDLSKERLKPLMSIHLSC